MPNLGPPEDLDLAHRVLDGSLEAWHEFIERYTGLLHHTIRKVLRDRDDIATVYVAVLERLYRGQLAQYRGDARLETWLVFVGRSAALDYARRRRGRRRPPAHLQGLGELDREVYRLHFERGLGLDAVRHRMRESGVPADEVEASLGRVGEGVSPARRRTLAWDRQARAVAAESGRLLAYLEQQRVEAEERRWAQNPETLRLEREAFATMRRIRAVIETLPPADREVLALRFEQGLSARQIAARLGLSGPRRAFTILDAAVRHVRRAVQVRTE